ncbi:hypothetical protein IG631_03829 [Alternaria alternata]|nr:hypothetical protein IG631_03829 [Alternaria alternata]
MVRFALTVGQHGSPSTAFSPNYRNGYECVVRTACFTLLGLSAVEPSGEWDGRFGNAWSAL